MPGYGKKIGEEGFDLGTDNWNKVEDSKYQKPKKITDKVIEEKESNNTNESI